MSNNETNDEAYLHVIKGIDRENENIISVNGILRYIISVSDGQNNTNQIEARSSHSTETGSRKKIVLYELLIKLLRKTTIFILAQHKYTRCKLIGVLNPK